MSGSLPSEQGVERTLLEWLDGLGWETHGLDGSHGATVLDERYGRRSNEVIYWDLLAEQVVALNDEITTNNVGRFLNSLRRDLDHDDLMAGNRAFYDLLRKGKKFTVDQQENGTKTIYVELVDFDRPEANRFHAVNQYEVSRTRTIRPDVSLFVNGIPLVQMELKSLAQDNDYYDAITDLQAYEDADTGVPRLFIPGLLNVAADTTELRYGAVGAPREHYEPWTPRDDDIPLEFYAEDEMKQAVQALCNPVTLLDVLHNFVLYDRAGGDDAKIVPRHMQYYGTNRILNRIGDDEADCGLVWHTQGSGKSITMIYTAKNLLERGVLDSPQVFLIVDTDKLNSQMRDDLSNLSFDRWEEATSIDDLQGKIAGGKSELVVTTIQKFQDVDPEVQSNETVVALTDEAHRFMEADLGSRLKAAFTNYYHFGFTGTPVREGDRRKDRNTFRAFSPEGEEYLHRYSIKQGIEDELILPVYFTLRHEMKWDIDEAGLDEEFEAAFAGMSTEEKREFIKDNVTSRELAELEPRVERVAEEIDEHFDEHVAPNGWKGMVVTPSRRSAAMYGERLLARRPADEVAVLYTGTTDDSPLIRQFHTDADERDEIVKAFKKTENPKLLVVHDMLLTGFNAPVLKTMYLDRNLRDHTLMQAIARTNRPAEGKENGEIVDFQGVFENVDEALDYDAETRAYAARDKDELYDELVEEVERLLDIFADVPKSDSQEAVRRALDIVSTHPEKRDFKQGFRRLQDLYESVAPDERLVTEGVAGDYTWLTRIHTAFQRDNNRQDHPEDEMRAKTREILNEHIDIGEIKRDFPVYEIGKKHLEAVDEMETPVQKATSIAHATRDYLRPKVGQNPRYKRLSERVTEIVETWEHGHMGDPEAVEALRAVEEDVLAVSDDARARGMSPTEHAVYLALVDDPNRDVSESTAAEMADAIAEAFEDVDHDYPGWAENEATEKHIERLVLDIVVVEYDRGDLIDDDFMDDVRGYLIQNHV